MSENCVDLTVGCLLVSTSDVCGKSSANALNVLERHAMATHLALLHSVLVW